MITIKQASEVLKVTPQAIYKRINDNDNNSELINYIQTDEKGLKTITDDGLTYLKQIFHKVDDKAPIVNENSELIQLLTNDLKRRDEEIRRLYDDIRELKEEYREQLKIKDEQIERLQKSNESSHSIIQSMQQQQLLLTAPGRKGFLSWLKKNNESEG